MNEAPPKDQKILLEAQEKHESKRNKKLGKQKITKEIKKTPNKQKPIQLIFRRFPRNIQVFQGQKSGAVC